MIVYHGTMDRYAQDIYSNGIKFYKSKKYLDFGRGFYVTPSLDFAQKIAFLRANKNNWFNENRVALPSIVSLELKEELFSEISFKRFDDCDLEWARFVVNNRLGRQYVEQYGETLHNIDKQYDIVFGKTADKNVSKLDALAKKGYIEINQELIQSILPKEIWGDQFSIHTAKGVSCISIIGYDIISAERSER